MIGVIRWVLRWWSSVGVAPPTMYTYGTVHSPAAAGTVLGPAAAGTVESPTATGVVMSDGDWRAA